jgi:hypothetical protein
VSRPAVAATTIRSANHPRLSGVVLYAALIVLLAELIGLLGVLFWLRIVGYCLAFLTLFRYHALRSTPPR